MKKNILVVLLLSAIVSLSSCGGGHSAEYVNKTIVEKADKVVELMQKAYNHIDNDRYSDAQAYLDSVSNYVVESKPIIAALNNKSAEEMKQATLEYIELFKGGVADYRQAIELYQTAQENEQFEQANSLINDFIEKADRKLSELRDIQVIFAERNNITLEK